MKLLDRLEWPLKRYWIDIGWVLFSLANLWAMVRFADWETVPFHFIWVSLTIVYGFRVWSKRPTALALGMVMVATAGFIGFDVSKGSQPIDELTEVPLMAAMFLAMVWHAQRRRSAMEQIERVSETNLRLLEHERRFIQDASHELRTPITVALGHAELIQRSALDSTVAEDAKVVTDELMRLRRLADRLLLLAAAEHADFLRLGPVDVEALAVETFRRWTPTPRRWTLSQLDEATVTGDPDRLSVALDALVENAVEHTEEGDEITLSVSREGTSAVISIADTGPGIRSEDLARIFGRFARAGDGRRADRGGVGLGLSIVKAIAEAHGGVLRAQSEEGRGAAFEMVLPIAGTPSPRPPSPQERERTREPQIARATSA